MLSKLFIPALAALLLLSLAQGAAAHRAPGSLTTIAFNEQSGMTEIVHRLHLHDAEIGVATVIGNMALTLTDLEGRAQVALYVEQRFAVLSDKEALSLDIVGAQISGDYLLVYQEYAGQLPASITVRDDILMDAFDRQVNQVNIDDGGKVRTLSFSGDKRLQAFRFENREAIAGSH